MRDDALGPHSLSKLDYGGLVRSLVSEKELGRTGEPTLRGLIEALISVYGTDYGLTQSDLDLPVQRCAALT